MKKQSIVYTINEKVPEALAKALCNALDKRDHIDSMIKSYTDDWVKNEKLIMELHAAVKKLNEE
jgi:hypothetical protein